jgi:hypothetical protein
MKLPSSWLKGGRGFGRPALVAIAFTGAATSLAAVPRGVSTAGAALVYVLAVTGASALAGLRAGVVA